MNSSKKVILLYRAGSKGDLLCNFLLNQESFGINGRNEIIGELNHRLKNLDARILVDNKDRVAEKAINDIKEFSVKIATAHSIDLYPNWFFEELKDTHQFVFLDPVNYYKNIQIDFFLKRYDTKITPMHKIVLLGENIKNAKTAKYQLDARLLKNNIPLTYENRINFIKSALSKPVTDFPINKKTEKYFNIIQYKDVFFPPFEGMRKLMELVDTERNLSDWRDAVIRSYLPKKVEVFGEIIYPKDYGYVWHYEKENL